MYSLILSYCVFPIIAVLLLLGFFCLEGTIQDHVKNTVKSKTVVKLKLLNNAIKLVWARPGDVLIYELRVIQ